MLSPGENIYLNRTLRRFIIKIVCVIIPKSRRQGKEPSQGFPGLDTRFNWKEWRLLRRSDERSDEITSFNQKKNAKASCGITALLIELSSYKRNVLL